MPRPKTVTLQGSAVLWPAASEMCVQPCTSPYAPRGPAAEKGQFLQEDWGQTSRWWVGKTDGHQLSLILSVGPQGTLCSVVCPFPQMQMVRPRGVKSIKTTQLVSDRARIYTWLGLSPKPMLKGLVRSEWEEEDLLKQGQGGAWNPLPWHGAAAMSLFFISGSLMHFSWLWKPVFQVIRLWQWLTLSECGEEHPEIPEEGTRSLQHLRELPTCRENPYAHNILLHKCGRACFQSMYIHILCVCVWIEVFISLLDS